MRERPFHVVGQVGARTPKDLAHVFGKRQRIRIVRGDAADARIDGERDFDQLVEIRFDVGHAEGAKILVLVQRLQRGAGFDHAAAAGTQHIPRHVEQPEPGRMDERPDGRLLVEAALGGEDQRIDAAQRPVGVGRGRSLERLRDGRLGGLAEQVPER